MHSVRTILHGFAAVTLLVGLVGLVSLAGTVAGCVVREPEAPPRGVVVSGPPPAPMPEDRPAPPGEGAVWIAGYWHWTGMQYAWIPGHWERPPEGAVWAAPRVTSAREGNYVYESGGWQKAPPSRNAIR